MEISDINPRPNNGEDDMGFKYDKNKREKASVLVNNISWKPGLISFSGDFISATDNSSRLEAMPG